MNELGARLRERDLTARSCAASAGSVATSAERRGLEEHDDEERENSRPDVLNVL